MSKLQIHKGVGFFFIAIFVLALLTNTQYLTAFELDDTKYFPFDQIKPDMDAYCLSVMSGTTIEKYPLRVLSKIENYRPGLNRILVVGTDETFKRIGPVQGCSGSPIYIDNRLVGALSAGYPLSKDPIYMVTPIAEMLTIGTAPDENYSPGQSTADHLSIDYSKPINLSEVSENILKQIQSYSAARSSTNPISLATSLPESAVSQLRDLFEPLNMVPLADVSSATSLEFATDDATLDSFQPGGILSLPLVSGDISIAAIGTITEVIDNTVYGFGHDFIGYGKLNVPMATGYIHTIIPNLQMSFKLGSAGPISGTLVFDEFTGVVGKIGQKPKLIPLNITVDRFNDIQTRRYKCLLAYNNLYSPVLLRASIVGASLMKGALPAEHTVSYKLKINVDGYDPIIFDDISSGRELLEASSNAVGVVGLIMDNPYQDADITSVDADIKITAADTLAYIDSVKLDDKILKPGQTLSLEVALERFKTQKAYYTLNLDLPADIQPGQYSVYVAGGDGYEQLLSGLYPHKFSARSLPTLIDALNNLTIIKHNKLHLILQLPPKGVTIMEKELPLLPNTKTLLLANPIRTTEVKPYNPWIETSIDTDMVIAGGREIKIIIEQ